MAIVRLTIRGLCLFVHQKKANKIHVLMPSTKGCSGIGARMAAEDDATAMEEHVARLVYDEAYDQRSQSLSGKARAVSLRRASIDTAEISKERVDPALPREMLSLTRHLKHATLEPSVLPPQDDPRMLLDARLTLSNGRCTETAMGASFRFRGTTARRAWGLEWTVCKAKGGRVTWEVPGLSGQKSKVLDLYPVGDLLDLFVYHLPKSQDPTQAPLCGAPSFGTKAMHFCAHYHLFNNTTANQTNTFPIYSPKVRSCLRPASPRGVTPYTCLPGSITH